MAEATTQPTFEIHRLYVKDLSLESPRSPEVFREQKKFKLDVHVDNNSKDLEDDVVETSLKVTVTATLEGTEDVAYLVEVTYGGIFTMKDFSEEQKKHVMNTTCPNILFPYVREAVSELVNRGGFPTLYLAPINFDGVYAQQQAEKDKETADAGKGDKTVH